MNIAVFESLYNKRLITEETLGKIRHAEESKSVSVHWELKTMLYLGVLLFSGGLGIMVYKNIGTIGHAAVLSAIAFISVLGFYYCFIKKQPFTFEKAESPHILFDYLLLLSSLLMICFFSYIQYQYRVFGERFGLAAFLPMILLFAAAYFYDHLGVLSLAITNLGAWLGLSITPLTLIRNFDWNTEHMIYTGSALGAFLIGLSIWSELKKIKSHFAFTYFNFGMHLLFVSVLAGMFVARYYYLLWFLFFIPVCIFIYYRALVEISFYKLLFAALYGYVALSYVVVRSLAWIESRIDDGGMILIYLGFFYFIGSAAALIVFLSRMNKKFRAYDGL